jgi:DNA-binding transcriptional MerR regulator
MPFHALSTGKIARAVGCHPNTVRRYEEWGYIPPAQRSPAGYRLFEPFHLDQMRLARLLMEWPYPGGKRPVEKAVRAAAAGNLLDAQAGAQHYLDRIHAEIEHSRASITALESLACGQASLLSSQTFSVKQVRALLDLSRDTLRSWERNNLIIVPRDPRNRYRRYTSAEIARLRVIRMLRQAGFGLMAVLKALTRLDRGEIDAARCTLTAPGKDEDILHTADRWLETLLRRKENALTAINLLEEMQRRFTH